MLNKTIPVGGSTVIHSNPVNELEGPVAPPSPVNWASSDASFGTLTPGGGPLKVDALYQSTTGVAGVTTITMACAGKINYVTVTVEAPGSLPFDHFSPSFD